MNRIDTTIETSSMASTEPIIQGMIMGIVATTVLSFGQMARMAKRKEFSQQVSPRVINY